MREFEALTLYQSDSHSKSESDDQEQQYLDRLIYTMDQSE